MLTMWDGLIIAAVCLFVGAGLMRQLIVYSVEKDLDVAGFRWQFLEERQITAAFHRQYHTSWWPRTVEGTRWMGAKVMQTPLDMWMMQEILHETGPDVLIETGTHHGGSSRYYASIFDLLGRGRVLTVDIEKFPNQPAHPRVEYFVGSSTDPSIVAQMRSRIRPDEKVMVVLDSDHAKEHVLKEIDAYSDLVCTGCYLVVQDTHLNGNPVFVPFSPGPGKLGPMEAVNQFLAKDRRFAADRNRERFGLTFNPNGWLKRIQ